MANTLLEFVVRAKDDASAALGKISGAATDLRGVMVSLATGAGPIGAIGVAAAGAVGGIVSASIALADMVEQLDRTAANTGLTVTQIQVLRRVAEEGGGSIDAMTSAVIFLNKTIGAGHPLIKQLGLDTEDTYTAFVQLAGILSSTEDEYKRTFISTQLLGKSSTDLASELASVASSADDVEAAMRRSGEALGGDALTNARELDRQVDELGRTWAGAMTRLQVATLPIAIAVVGALERMSGAADNALKALRGIPGVAVALLVFQAGLRGKGSEDTAPIDPGVPYGPQNRDPLTDITVTDPKPESPREKRLREIARLLSVGRVEAERYLVVLEGLEDAKRRASLLEDLSRGGIIPGASQSPVQMRGGPQPLAPTAPSDFDQEQHLKNVRAILEAAPKASAALIEIGTSWRNTVDEILSVNGMLEDGLGSLYAGIQQGFATVFANLTNRAQTLRSALKTIFSSLVSEVLAMLGRLAAAKLFQFILNLLLPGSGTAASAATGAVGGFPGVTDVMAPAPPTTVYNVNINALNSRDARLSLMSPRGELRQAIRDAGSGGY